MTPEQILDALEPMIRQFLQGDKTDGPIVVVRSPEGLLVLQRNTGGRHALIQVNSMELVVS